MRHSGKEKEGKGAKPWHLQTQMVGTTPPKAHGVILHKCLSYMVFNLDL